VGHATRKKNTMLAAYQNGNVSVQLFEDGTKIREYEGTPLPVFPESIDVKVTNYCDAGCGYCHEMSTKKGTHGDLTAGLRLLTQLPQGSEIAIGGGNPFDHPELVPFLQGLRAHNLVPNLTVNQLHIKKYHALIQKLLDEKLIFGLGISYYGANNALDSFMTPNTVLHMILGVHAYTELEKVKARWPDAKVLLLGYKTFGRGATYKGPVETTIKGWYDNLKTFFNTDLTISFDNLGIEQMNLRRFFSPKAWERFYMGDDGTFTMYMDLVKQQYAPTSTSPERFSIADMGMASIFAHVRSMKP
jgi:hypothetical protein